jgi:hypothetical protein
MKNFSALAAIEPLKPIVCIIFMILVRASKKTQYKDHLDNNV